MMVYWASIGCIVGILFFVSASIAMTEDGGYLLQLLALAIIIMLAIALGMRIEGGVF